MNTNIPDSKQMDTAYKLRIGGLRRFAIAITVLNILGHLFFGFEQSYAQPLVALATAYGMELLLEVVSAKTQKRPYKFSGGVFKFIDFMLPAHISALAVSMLLYTNETLLPVAFATAAAIGSKAIFRAQVGEKSMRHFYNPSNFGITVTLLLFTWVGIAPPYQFTENLDRIGDWVLPAFIVVSGTMLNALFTKRLPLIGAWLIGFAAQAVIRNLFFESTLAAAFLPMTGVAFILYTYYMVTDPATTPNSRKGQIIFGLANAGIYGLLMVSHIVFGLFFALTITCTIRGLVLLFKAALARQAQENRVAEVSSVPAATAAMMKN
jgi:Na+-translocating ferredoxin:NAD+ oxidoreductase RnfD subunit